MTSALGPVAATLSSVTWAVGSAGYSKLAREHSPFAVNFTRAVVALPLFTLAAIVFGGGLGAAWHGLASLELRQLGWFVLAVSASYGLGDSLFLISTGVLGVPTALAIGSAFPLWTSLAGVLFRGEALTGAQVLGLLLAVAGVATVILAVAPEAQGAAAPRGRPRSRSVGLALAVAVSVLWGIHNFAIAHVGREVSVLTGNVVRMILAMGLSWGFSRGVVRGASRPRSMLIPWSALAPNLWFFVFEAFCGSFLFFYGVAHSPLALGSVLVSLAPILSVPAAWALGLERISPLRICGLILVVAGLGFLIGYR